jgi:hypothetical protein
MSTPSTLDDLWFLHEELCRRETGFWLALKSEEDSEIRSEIRAHLSDILNQKWEICKAIHELQDPEIIEIEGVPF